MEKRKCDKVILTKEITKRRFFFFNKKYKINLLMLDREILSLKNIRNYSIEINKEKAFFEKYYRDRFNGSSLYLIKLECFIENISFEIRNNSITPIISYKRMKSYFFNGSYHLLESDHHKLHGWIPEVLESIDFYQK